MKGARHAKIGALERTEVTKEERRFEYMVRTPAQSHDEGTNCDYEAEFVFDTWIQTALWQNVKDAAPRRAGHFRCSSLQSSKLQPIELNRKKWSPETAPSLHWQELRFVALSTPKYRCVWVAHGMHEVWPGSS